MEMVEELQKSISYSGDIPIVKFSECQGHFYHKECALSLMKEDHVKCCMCQKFYGESKGDMGPGTMTWREIKYHCDGYEESNTFEISYKMGDSIKDGQRYHGCK